MGGGGGGLNWQGSICNSSFEDNDQLFTQLHGLTMCQVNAKSTPQAIASWRQSFQTRQQTSGHHLIQLGRGSKHTTCILFFFPPLFFFLFVVFPTYLYCPFFFLLLSSLLYSPLSPPSPLRYALLNFSHHQYAKLFQCISQFLAF